MSRALAATALLALAAGRPPPKRPRLPGARAHEVVAGPIAGPLQTQLPPDLLSARMILLGESHGGR